MLKSLMMLAVGLSSLPISSRAESLSGLPYITDADTVTISGTRVRLAGIDAPEMGQTCLDKAGRPYQCGVAAREALTAFAAGKEWRCELQARPDRYGRRVGTCGVGNTNVNRWLVREGWALDYKHFSRGSYAHDEAEARMANRGLWAGSFLAPWDARRRHCGERVLGSGPMSIGARAKLC